MTTIQSNVPPEAVRQGARHLLFVEGNDDDALDPQVLSGFLPMVQVKALGASFHIRSAAEALSTHHPTYYFLIDRDHHDDAFVEECWMRFPDPSKSNLLVWPRRELENYFLIPEYMERSDYLNVGPEKLRGCIRKWCQRRLYLDAANQVVVSLREDLKQKWVETFTRVQEFDTKEKALDNLRAMPELVKRIADTATVLDVSEVESRFLAVLEDFTGGNDLLEYGSGRWLEMVRGKKILPSVLHDCFRVKDARGAVVQDARDCLIEVAKDLLRKDLSIQPADFQCLYRIIENRINSAG